MMTKAEVPTDEEKARLARQFWEGLRNRDRYALASIFTEDVVWSNPGQTRISGEARGLDAIMKRAQDIADWGVKIELEYILYGLSEVALHLHNTGNKNSRIFDEHVVIVFIFRDGRISRLVAFLSDIPMMNAYFA
jgi:uncharacterized protein